jgi:hypothetical protein
MIHIFKKGGDWTRDGIKYTVKVVGNKEYKKMLKEGWKKSFEDVKAQAEKDKKKEKKEAK